MRLKRLRKCISGWNRKKVQIVLWSNTVLIILQKPAMPVCSTSVLGPNFLPADEKDFFFTGSASLESIDLIDS